MGSLGWSPSEVDKMETWQIGLFLGVHGHPPVIRGSRGLAMPDDDKPSGPSGRRPPDSSLGARIARQKRIDAERGTPDDR